MGENIVFDVGECSLKIILVYRKENIYFQKCDYYLIIDRVKPQTSSNYVWI